MFTLYHHPFCPHSRFIRLVLGEYGFDVQLVDERVWERRTEFLTLNPAGTTPVLIEDGMPPMPGASVIAESLDECHGIDRPDRRLLPFAAADRIEARRLTSWFNDKFFTEVSGPLIGERIYKRFMPTALGGGAPLADVIRAAKANARIHLSYIGWLARQRNFLAGDALTLADLAAAAHLSAIDYLGDVPWDADEAAKVWYARIKSRPSFRPLLRDALPGVVPVAHYADLDF